MKVRLLFQPTGEGLDFDCGDVLDVPGDLEEELAANYLASGLAEEATDEDETVETATAPDGVTETATPEEVG